MDTTSLFLPFIQLDDLRKAGDKINITRSVELMENHMAARPCSAIHPIAAALDNRGQPMIFSLSDSLGGKARLQIIVRDAGAAGGWRAPYDLTTPFGPERVAQQFAILQMPDLTVVLAVALEKIGADGEKASDLYITGSLPNNPEAVNWTALAWTHCPAPRDDLLISEISVGRDSHTLAPLLFVSTASATGDAGYWAVIASTVAVPSWQGFGLPTNAPMIIDLAFGNHLLGNGVYVLYRSGPDRVLVFITIDGAVTCQLTPPKGAAKLEALTNDEGLSTLYVAGDEVHEFAPDNQLSGARGTPVALGAAGSRCKSLIACQDLETIFLWLVTDQRRMLYTSRKRASPGSWSAPTELRGGVAQIAPLRNPDRKANELIWASADGGALGHLTQDPRTETWTHIPIQLPASDKTTEFSSYVTTICLSDQNHMPLRDQTVRLGASSWVYASVNGVYYELDSDTRIPMKTDARGCIQVTNQVSSIITPVFFIEADFFSQPIDIVPSTNVNAKLAKAEAKDLPPSNKTDGPKPDDKSRANMLLAVQELVKLNRPENQTHRTAPRAGALAADRVDAATSNRIQLSHIPANHCWGLEFAADGPVEFWGPTEARNVLSGGINPGGGLRAGVVSAEDESWIDRAVQVSADILESLAEGLEKAKRFVVSMATEAAELIIDLGSRVVKFLVHTVEQVASAINWIFKEGLGIDLGVAVRWLGFVFDWGDIKLTHRATCHIVKIGFDTLMKKAEKLEGTIKESFEELRKCVGGDKYNFDDTNEIFRKRPTESMIHQNALLSNSSQGGWAQRTLEYNLGSAGVAAVTLAKELTQIIIDTVNTEVAVVESFINHIINDIVEKIDTLTFGEIVERVMVIFTNTVLLGSIENVALSVVQVAEAFARALWAILNAELRIPILSSLYSSVITDGRKLTLLDAICLVSAIPATIAYKLAEDAPPFTAADIDRLESAADIDGLVALLKTPRHLATGNLRLSASNGLGAALSDSTPLAIATISPATGLRNTLVTIKGTGLAGVKQVIFSDNVVANVLDEDHTDYKLFVRAPQGFVNGPISIKAPDGKTVVSPTSFSWDSRLVGIHDFQTALGFLLAFTREGSGIAYTLSEYYDFRSTVARPDPPAWMVLESNGFRSQKQTALEFKFGFDIATYLISVVNAITSATTTSNSDSAIIDQTIQYAQILPRIKDGVQVFIWRYQGTEASRQARTALALVYETSVGIISMPLIIASTVLKAQNPSAGLTPSDAATVLSLKSAQNFSNAIVQILSAPKTAIAWFDVKQPPTLQGLAAKTVMIATRVTFGLVVLPAFSLSRVIVDLGRGHQFVDM